MHMITAFIFKSLFQFYFILFYFILFYFTVFYFTLLYCILFYFTLLYFILFYSEGWGWERKAGRSHRIQETVAAVELL